ncbi:MAG: DUF2461 domain-containing protein [Acidimicrobiales bacterium]
MAFKGWPAHALEFYEGLEADNSRVYWMENKAVYDADVHAPMAALLAELEEEFGPGRIFRPYRDVRFSANKAPYKTAIAATVGAGYVQLSADGLMAGAGMYHMAPDQLERYRRAVDDHKVGTGLETLVASLEKAKMEVYGSDALKTAPKGYPKDHPRIGLLRNKGLVAIRRWSPAPWLGTAGAKERVAGALRVSGQLAAWLDGQVGPSTLEESGRR